MKWALLTKYIKMRITAAIKTLRAENHAVYIPCAHALHLLWVVNVHAIALCTSYDYERAQASCDIVDCNSDTLPKWFIRKTLIVFVSRFQFKKIHVKNISLNKICRFICFSILYLHYYFRICILLNLRKSMICISVKFLWC